MTPEALRRLITQKDALEAEISGVVEALGASNMGGVSGALGPAPVAPAPSPRQYATAEPSEDGGATAPSQVARVTGPVEGRLVVTGASRPLLVGPGDWVTHARTFRRVEVLLAWRQSGVDWFQARNALGRVINEQATGFDLATSTIWKTFADAR